MSREVPLTECLQWKLLQEHFTQCLKSFDLKEAFKNDLQRFEKFSKTIDLEDGEEILVDFSKNLINEETFKLLMALVDSRRVTEWIANMFSGYPINFTENRSVLHVALRYSGNAYPYVDLHNVLSDVNVVLKMMEDFAEHVREGKILGFTGKVLTNIVNIGIGGSDLGPCMAVEALKHYIPDGMKFYFVSNIDGTHIREVLKVVDPETTLFIVASKTFTTMETIVNAVTAKDWLLSHLNDPAAIAHHFIAISTNKEQVAAFGINEKCMFEFWDWVGGRYSMMSAIGMPIMIAIGKKNFRRMLRGAYLMDHHFMTELPENNIPIILAMIGILYNNFFGFSTHAILPYEQYLWKLPAYLQQADMESNGKYVTCEHKEVDYSTGPIIWGQPGTNGQHAFYQLIHQGTKIVPADFLVGVNSLNPVSSNVHQDILLANFLAQTEALCLGRSYTELLEQNSNNVLTENEQNILKHKVFKGNRPTNSIVYTKLTPAVLGAIVAMYEHKIFVQGCIWMINSFDQWGVELGKKLATVLLDELKDPTIVGNHDSSTTGLLDYIRQKRC